jgi:two-component system, cell cycle sensor histidine kinase and response regulator CckA
MASIEPQLLQTILVVEDHTSLLEFVASILRTEGYRVLTAEDGGQALLAAGQHPGNIDLLLSDFELPVLHGDEVARRLTALYPGIRVLIMSAWNPQWDRMDPQWEFLGKPFSAALLLTRLKELLSRARGAGAG